MSMNASPGADLDSDGDCDATDASIVQGWIDTSHYDARGDIDLDGDVDSTDKSTAAGTVYGTALGWRALSSQSLASTAGWAGSRLGASLSMLLHARARALHGHAGRLLQRDPLGYVDRPSLTQPLASNPIRYVDPSGNKIVGSYSAWMRCRLTCLATHSATYRNAHRQLQRSPRQFSYQQKNWGGSFTKLERDINPFNNIGYLRAEARINPNGTPDQGSDTMDPDNGAYDLAHETGHQLAWDNSHGGNFGTELDAHQFASQVMRDVDQSMGNDPPKNDPCKDYCKPNAHQAGDHPGDGGTCGTAHIFDYDT